MKPVPPLVCIQVITPAQNPQTGECKNFPTPCDVSTGWQKVEKCVPLSITTFSLLNGTVKTSYSASISALGGSDSYMWSVSNGALPPGLMLNFPICITSPCQAPVGIYGTPTTAGSYTFTVTVKSGTQTASKQFTISIVVASSTAAYFEFTDTVDKFIFQLNNGKDDDEIAKARDILSGKVTDTIHVGGKIVKESVSYNPNWSFYLDPGSIYFFEGAIEVCDSSIRGVQDHLGEVGGSFLPGNFWCSWSSKMTREISGSVLVPSSQYSVSILENIRTTLDQIQKEINELYR